MHTASRILAIESDPERAEQIRRLVGEFVDAEVVVASSTERAVATLADHWPALILTSALMPPRDAAHLTSHLARVPDLCVPVLTVPPDVATASAPRRRRSLFARAEPPRASASQAAFGSRIREAFEHARARPQDARALPVAGDGQRPETDIDREGVRIRRAQRMPARDVYWLTGIRLPSGAEVQLLNISRTGLLVESGSDLMPGSVTTFTLLGSNRDVPARARIVRSEMATVGANSVRYQAAAAFDRELELLAPPAAVRVPPATLDELGAAVRRDAQRGIGPDEQRAAFERGLMHLVRARDIRFRPEPVPQAEGESIYFTVPTAWAPQPVLQVTFERDAAPSPEEFETLERASVLAAAVLSP